MSQGAANILGGITGLVLGALFIRSGLMEKCYRLIDRLLGIDA